MDIEKALVLDDEMIIRRTLQEYCHQRHIKVRTVETVQEALKALKENHGYDLMFLDIHLPDGDGTEVLEAMQGREDAPLGVMITGQGTIDSAVTCMQLGAHDYLLKPFSVEQVDLTLQRLAKYSKLVQLNRELSGGTAGALQEMIGDSPEMHRLTDLIQRVARTDATVLVTGETGTGKELVAQAIHQNSFRKDKPFIKVNCAAVSESLIESEFFGHEKGAFTGAMNSRAGRFELADGGTILLDEISEVSLTLQAKLLRVLQEKELERVGGSKTIPVDVRIIATTNRDLASSVEAGEFRQDLYYRLNVFPVRSPSLREHKGDIRRLAHHFLQRFARKHCRQHGRKLRDFSEQAYVLLCRHSWPGNVRELQNLVERSVILASPENELVDATVLPLEIQVLSEGEGDAEAIKGTLDPPEAPAEVSGPAEVAEDGRNGDPAERIVRAAAPRGDWSLENLERRLIHEALQHSDGNRSKAAEMMQISIRTLFNKLKLYRKKGYTEFEPYFNS